MRPPYSPALFELLCEQAERFPERIAVICSERVGILVNNRLEWLEVCFGITALGAVAVPFSTWSKPSELEFLLADSAVDGLIAVDSFAGQDFSGSLADLAPN